MVNVRKNLADAITAPNVFGRSPLPSFEIEWMLVGADDSGNALGFDSADRDGRFSHRRSDWSPSSHVSENHIPGDNFLDWDVPALRTNDSTGDKARVSSEQGVDGAGKRLCVESGEVSPDRGWGKVSGALAGDDGPSGVFLPLDKASRVEAGLGEHEAHIKSTAACAEGQSVPGT